MRFQYTVAACAAALAVLIVPLAATPAAAALPTTSDTVTEHEFSGHMDIGWRVQPYRLDPIQITLKDTATDGYSIGIRLVTYGENGKIIWKLRTIPAGQDTAYWTTYAEPGGYISSAYFDVCKIKVSTGTLWSCESSRVMNAPFDDSSVSRLG